MGTAGALSLEGQVAVVTGGASGIGAAIAEGLAEDGATVEVFDLENGVDVTDEQSVAKASQEVVGRHRRIDVLVNNAGIYPHIPFEEMTFAQWRHVLATNLDGVFLCSHAVYPVMRSRRYGRIVNISSATFFIGYPGLSAYVASKGGIIGLTRALAREAGPHQITVNAVTPGLIATERALDEEADVFDEIVPEQAVQRPGTPQDISDCVRFLVRPESSWITGQTFNVDGGHRFN
ncbi:MAG TPA: SDR family NAD(P)-dependent oxidoreductase [Solirubrobacteraceae bacterium]|nr:SDR family NAD(P)-dependent oxidoreductase [Solirubrobacteraceae bacterium]